MSRADGTLFKMLGDEVCLAILHALVAADHPLTQRAVVAELKLTSGAISRRMAEMEAAALVARPTPHGPYELVYPAKTGELLQAGADLASMTHQGLAEEAQATARSLRKARMTTRSTVGYADDSA